MSGANTLPKRDHARDLDHSMKAVHQVALGTAMDDTLTALAEVQTVINAMAAANAPGATALKNPVVQPLQGGTRKARA